jgi:hypothetical protein
MLVPVTAMPVYKFVVPDVVPVSGITCIVVDPLAARTQVLVNAVRPPTST